MSAAPERVVEGPAFTRSIKGFAGLVLVALLVMAGSNAAELQRLSTSTLLFVGAAMIAVVICYGWMLRSRTSISTTHIRQTWMIADKQVALTDITRLRLIYVPGLAWLIAPRLVVRTGVIASQVFHTADPRVLAAFVRLATGRPPFE